MDRPDEMATRGNGRSPRGNRHMEFEGGRASLLLANQPRGLWGSALAHPHSWGAATTKLEAHMVRTTPTHSTLTALSYLASLFADVTPPYLHV